MSTILTLSLAGSPGVTTTSLAMALSWPQSVLLVEADSSRYSSVLPGYFRGQIAHIRGIGELPVVANNNGSLDINQLWAQTISLIDEAIEGPQRRLIPGFKNPAAARAMDPVWVQLATAASSFEGMGMDVIIDAGHWNVSDSRSALLRAADAVVIFARPTLPDIVAVHKRLASLRSELAATGRDGNISLVLIEASTGPQLSSAEIHKALGLDQSVRMGWDDKTAVVYSLGEPLTKKLEKTKFGRGLTPIIELIRGQLALQRERLSESRDSRESETEARR